MRSSFAPHDGTTGAKCVGIGVGQGLSCLVEGIENGQLLSEGRGLILSAYLIDIPSEAKTMHFDHPAGR